MSGWFKSPVDTSSMAAASLSESAKIADALGRDHDGAGQDHVRRLHGRGASAVRSELRCHVRSGEGADRRREILEQARDAYAYSKTFRPMAGHAQGRDELEGRAQQGEDRARCDHAGHGRCGHRAEEPRRLVRQRSRCATWATTLAATRLSRSGSAPTSRVRSATRWPMPAPARPRRRAVRSARRCGTGSIPQPPGPACSLPVLRRSPRLPTPRAEGITSARENLLKTMATRQSLFGVAGRDCRRDGPSGIGADEQAQSADTRTRRSCGVAAWT